MFDDLPPISHKEQQEAVERIQELMAKAQVQPKRSKSWQTRFAQNTQPNNKAVNRRSRAQTLLFLPLS